MARLGYVVACLAACALSACASGAHATAAQDDQYVALYRALHPSVVLLTMQIPADDPKRKGAWDDAYGSGVVVASGAWGTRILTDKHVIDGARGLEATIGDRAHAPARRAGAGRRTSTRLKRSAITPAGVRSASG